MMNKSSSTRSTQPTIIIIASFDIILLLFVQQQNGGLVGAQTCGTASVQSNFGTGTTVPQNLCVPPLAYNQSSIWLVWNKPDQYSTIVDYNVYMNGQKLGSASANAAVNAPAYAYINGLYKNDSASFHNKITYQSYLVTGLSASSKYNFTVRSVNAAGTESADSAQISVTTAPAYAKIYDVSTLGAKGDGQTNNTLVIQQAINNCANSTSAFGCKVVIPAGASSGNVYVSGALFLFSNMTLEIQNGATLKADNNTISFPMGMGYVSGRPPALLNAFSGKPVNIKITGTGIIDGTGWQLASSITDEQANTLPVYANGDYTTVSTLGVLAKSQMAAAGGGSTNYANVRSSLAIFEHATNVYVGDVTMVNPAFHNIQFIICTNVVLANARIRTYNVNNGDGAQLSGSNTVMIFNNMINAGDDCISTSAGQGSSGESGNPVQYVRLFNNYFREGHSMFAAGSLTAAWIEDVLAEDNVAFLTQNGLRMKSTPPTGGGAQRIVFRDSALANVGTKNSVTLSGKTFTGDANGSPVIMTVAYSSSTTSFTKASKCAHYTGITVQNVSVDNVSPASGGPMIAIDGYDGSVSAWGYVDTFQTNITFSNLKFKNVVPASISRLKSSTFSNVTVTNWDTSSSPWSISNSSSLTSSNVTPALPTSIGK